MIQILVWIFDLLKSRSAFIVGIYTLASTALAHIGGTVTKIASMVTDFDALTRPTFSSSGIALSPLSLMNYILPLDTAITLFGAWLLLWLACSTIRIVKSWIPTVA
jgi:hypothetical protein